MKHLNLLRISLVLWTILLVFNGCKKDKKNPKIPPVNDDFELITTVKLTFTLQGDSGSILTFYFKDTDGIGGNEPVQLDTIRLNNNKIYNCVIEFFDESNPNEIKDITEEIKEEEKEHLICFTPKSGLNLLIERTDSDGVYEVGLQSKWTSENSSSGTVKVVLKHQPDVKNGTCEPGETDVEVYFPVVIE